MSPRVRIIVLTFAGLVLPLSAMAQWTEQTIHLEPGWNAVFFEVEPSPRDCDSVFNGIPVESVWSWNRRFTPVQYLVDADTLLPEQPEWITYFPPTSARSHLTDLFIIRGGCPYLIKLGGSQAVDLVVKGQPKIRRIDWVSNSFNLVGFYVDDAAPPTFGDFFKASAAHTPPRVHRMDAAGDWQQVADTAAATMRRGEAYWVYCNGQSAYQGPLWVSSGVGTRLDYARIVMEHDLRIENVSDSEREITIRQRPSLPPPADDSLPALAGDVPLVRYEFFVPEGATTPSRYGWYPLPTPLSLTVGGGEELVIRLAVRRPEMVAFTPPAGRDYLYQNLLEVSDGAGSLLVVSVSANDLRAPRIPRPAGSVPGAAAGVTKFQGGATSEPAIHRGLWVGNVTVKAVSNPTSRSLDPHQPLPVASPFSFRLIVHLDKWGQTRLLPQVLQMWREGAWVPNPDDPTSQTFVLGEPGYTVLLTSDSLISQYGGVALRDTKLVGRRISTPAFGIAAPLDMDGEFGPGETSLTCQVVLGYNDRLNPFKHKYHPEHDNRDWEYRSTLDEGKESYTLIRRIALLFTDTDPEDLVSSDWGDETLGGFYNEAVDGLHRNTLYTSGTFRLQRISDVDVLNDGKL